MADGVAAAREGRGTSSTPSAPAAGPPPWRTGVITSIDVEALSSHSRPRGVREPAPVTGWAPRLCGGDSPPAS
ncbi:hypothetical protein QJS66_14510 [Kocuria rhizophila]|nr:hypothetical protein QJS66_14510 [Kocuria rhizophila]